MTRAVLVLEDGSVWEGKGFGAIAKVSGEVVFNTGMVGYPESITDPSYYGQILCQTYPLIGNYGVSSKGLESPKPMIKGYVVSEMCATPSHATSEKTLDQWLKENGIPGISGIDTRALTKRLRIKGVMLGILQTYEKKTDLDLLKEEAKNIPDPNERDLVSEVTTKEIKTYNKKGDKTIVLIDCGVKENIIRCLVKRNVKVVRVPADANFKKIMSFSPSGVLISNGPGDPKKSEKAIRVVKKLMDGEMPVFGICLGNQILSLAAGGDTYKLKFGHRSQNQPCIEEKTGRCYITSQNHGFAVAPESLSKEWKPWFTNANDRTNEGIMHRSKPWISVQFHPEASPGPVDTEFIFDVFLGVMK
ncbi:MAG: carbamoyl-phosphate synthase (glutamine-hydrolyzing) small subunit [Candidatus Aenigmatarchaeota archaeon]|nr:MAG: carbamoyl-phosphate synthase (glutamine-hydrolyzing) small subunit [Candidatus Aenigmarchaeota archaeon]